MAKVLISEKMNEIAAQVLRDAGHEVVQLTAMDQAEFAEAIKDCDALLNRILPVTAEMMKSNPKLQIISKHGVGIDQYDLKAAKELGIAVTTTPDRNGQSVAEHTLTLMMAVAKSLIPISEGYRHIGWKIKNSCEGVELFHKTVAVIGCGRIGRRVASMCAQGFQMRVLVYDPYITEVPEGCTLVKTLDEAISQADFITPHCYLSEETEGMIGAHEFSIMKPGAIIVNCARGPIINEEEMIRALLEKRLGGAGLDVTMEEPLPKDHILMQLDNVILTPHFAPTTVEAAYNVARLAAENIVHYLAGEPVEGRIV